MNSKIKYYNEKYFYPYLDIINVEELIDRGICEENCGQIIFNRTGIIFLKGSIYIIFPCGYKISSVSYDTELLLELFNRLAYEKKMDNEYYDLIDIDCQGKGHLLNISYEIIKDYKESGIVKIESVIQGLNIGGRVNWKKSVKLKTQMFNEDSVPIFTSLVMNSKQNNKDELLISLHLYAINKSIAMFGSLFGMSSDYDEDAIELPVSKEYSIKFLNSQKYLTYNSRLLRVIDFIIKFIDADEKEDENDSFLSLSTKSFYTVWELMCKVVLKDQYTFMENEIPKPYWKVGDGPPKYTQQIPDTLYIEQRKLFIVDAKYYNVSKNRPGWSDLVKQYFYSLSLQAVLKDIDEIYNIMLIPSEISDIARLWAMSEVENVTLFGKVHGIFINMNMVIETYCYGNEKDYRFELNKIVKKNKSTNYIEREEKYTS